MLALPPVPPALWGVLLPATLLLVLIGTAPPEELPPAFPASADVPPEEALDAPVAVEPPSDAELWPPEELPDPLD